MSGPETTAGAGVLATIVPDHPRPQLQRDGWVSLDGPWDFAIDLQGWARPDQVEWNATINVPFAPETPASGIGHTGFLPRCWYRRTIEAPALGPGECLVLHFGAVDYAATVWVGDHVAMRHEGGYSPFQVHLTDLLPGATEAVVTVLVEDDPLDLAKPRGKQDWELEPHSIWYHRTTGIWQTVWLETLPRVAVTNLQWSTDLDRSEVGIDVRFGGQLDGGLRLRVHLTCEGRELVDDLVGINGKRMGRRFTLDGTGLDALRDSLTWSPEHPVLVDATLEVLDVSEGGEGRVIDRVHSYTGLRTSGVRAGRFLLNQRPIKLRMVLDQGYWADTGLTPPSGEALRRDVELTKAMGFNGVRKHQKIEDPRYLYWADRLGLMVWEEMPPAYRFDNEAVRRTTREWTEIVERDRSHPCVVSWVVFNESTGVLSLPGRAEERHYVEGLGLITKALDPLRPVISNDGWEGVGGDIIGVHDYDPNPETLAARYSGAGVDELLRGYGDNGRLYLLDDPGRLVLEPAEADRRALMLTEFGGIGWAEDAPVRRVDEEIDVDAPADRLNMPASWGYRTVESAEALGETYAALLDAVHSVRRFAGFCYTQFADTYQEVNGLLYADRRPKVPIDVIARATNPARSLGPVATAAKPRRLVGDGSPIPTPADGAGPAPDGSSRPRVPGGPGSLNA